VAAFVIPLLTIYLMGVFTPVHRRSGTIGLLAGVAYGIVRLVATQIALTWGVAILPPLACDSFAAYPISLAVTAGTMIVVSLALGWDRQPGMIRQVQDGWTHRTELAAQAVTEEHDSPR